jgi:hypothetical protein
LELRLQINSGPLGYRKLFRGSGFGGFPRFLVRRGLASGTLPTLTL